MSKRAIMLALTAGLLASCQAADTPVTEDDISPIAYDKMRAFNAWLEIEKKKTAPEAFKPTPLLSAGVGRVKATPDIAVITGQILTEAAQDDTAIDDAAKIINAVQDAVKGMDVELNFTAISTSDKRDPKCLAQNAKAQARYSRIVTDNQYNANIKRQKEQGRDVKIKPRPALNRIDFVVCPVDHIDARLTFTARVKPAAKAGDIINDFTAAGVHKVDLYGYDFTDYDTLYKDASAKAVANAKLKAERTAKIAGTRLTEIVRFTVDAPQRTARFGPQAMIVSNHSNRNITAGNYTNQQFTVFNGVSQQVVQSSGTTVTNTGEVLCRVEIPARYKTIIRNGKSERVLVAPARQEWNPETQAIQSSVANGLPPANTSHQGKNWERRLVNGKTEWVENSAPNNALKMSLQAGQRTITVNAQLSYLYETPIDGTIAPDES